MLSTWKFTTANGTHLLADHELIEPTVASDLQFKRVTQTRIEASSSHNFQQQLDALTTELHEFRTKSSHEIQTLKQEFVALRQTIIQVMNMLPAASQLALPDVRKDAKETSDSSP
jgi:hypothetical protein